MLLLYLSLLFSWLLQVEIVQVLHRRHRIALNEIAILTPYSAQKIIIEEEYAGDWKSELTVATISESQGDYFSLSRILECIDRYVLTTK